MKDGITESERDQTYTSLVTAESEASDKLDDAIKAECLWFVEAALTVDDLRALSKLYPAGHRLHRSEAVLIERRKMGEAIPATRWNPALSYQAHVEAAKIRDPEKRWEVIASPPEVTDAEAAGEPVVPGTGAPAKPLTKPAATAAEMQVAVQKVRRENGEIRTPKRPDIHGQPTALSKINRAQGFVVSDQVTLAKGMCQMEAGEVVTTYKNTVPGSDEQVRVVGTPEVSVLDGGRTVYLRYTVAVMDGDE